MPFSVGAVAPATTICDPMGGAHVFGDVGTPEDGAVNVTVKEPVALVAKPVAPTVRTRTRGSTTATGTPCGP